MRGDGKDVGELPRLDAFDQEFGREPVAMMRRQRHQMQVRPLVGLLLAVAIISVPALAWLGDDGRPPPELQPGAMALQGGSRDGADEQIELLLRQIAALKQEVSERTQAKNAASARAAEQDPGDPAPVYWYSDLNALGFGIVREAKPGVVALPPRRAATVRPEARENRKRDDGAPLSLAAPE